MTDATNSNTTKPEENEIHEVELSDEDILDAMQHIPGYLDISTEDFREIYHLAHRHALKRLFDNTRAIDFMRTGIEPLLPDLPLDQAIASMARQGLKSLPVVDEENKVVGIITETDFLRRLNANTFMELLLRLVKDASAFNHRCHETLVSQVMTSSPVIIQDQVGFIEIINAFRRHDGHNMPVVNDAGRLQGMLSRNDIMEVFHLEELL